MWRRESLYFWINLLSRSFTRWLRIRQSGVVWRISSTVTYKQGVKLWRLRGVRTKICGVSTHGRRSWWPNATVQTMSTKGWCLGVIIFVPWSHLGYFLLSALVWLYSIFLSFVYLHFCYFDLWRFLDRLIKLSFKPGRTRIIRGWAIGI